MVLRKVRRGDPLGFALGKMEVLAGKNHNCFRVHNIHSDNLVNGEKKGKEEIKLLNLYSRPTHGDPGRRTEIKP